MTDIIETVSRAAVLAGCLASEVFYGNVVDYQVLIPSKGGILRTEVSKGLIGTMVDGKNPR